jgi:hypothetical protein
MKVQPLIPSVKQGDEADGSAEIFRIGSYLFQSFRNRLEQQVVHDRLVVQSHWVESLWDREDHMEIWNRQQLGFTRFHPSGPLQGLTFGAVTVAAGVVGNLLIAAHVTLQSMSPEGGGSTESDLLDDMLFLGGDARQPVPMKAENVR